MIYRYLLAFFLRRIPQDARVYISIDIDGLDPSIAPGTGTPSHGGFMYYEVKDWMGLAGRLDLHLKDDIPKPMLFGLCSSANIYSIYNMVILF